MPSHYRTWYRTIFASLTTIASEYSTEQQRNLVISFMHMRYPVGAILGGLVSVYLIGNWGWRSVFQF